MSRSIRVSILWICLAALLGGCLSSSVVVSDVDDGAARVLAVGDRLVVRLVGNPSTGYLWSRVLPDDLADGPLEVIEEGGFTASESSPGVVGAPGEFLFEYRAISSGLVNLGFAYERPWVGEAVDEWTVAIWVR